jgi:hypothetical protein
VNRVQNARVPEVVTDVRRRLDAWRNSRLKLGPIPAPLWKEAAALARAHGINAIAKALRLDYYSLKRQMEIVSGSPAVKPVASPAFVEVAVVPPSLPPAECAVELERSDGARMRIRTSRPEDLVVLAESFWRWRA